MSRKEGTRKRWEQRFLTYVPSRVILWVIMGDNTFEKWRSKRYAFFNHKECEFFPCHKTDDKENFNCLFCYCPLYILGDGCGGNPKYTEEGIKDCSGCTLPHDRENYGYVTGRFRDIAEKMKR
jgi:Zn-finger protein